MKENYGILGVSLAMVVIGLPVASYFMVFRPMNREIAKVRDEVKHREGLLTKLQEETARNADLERANREIADSITMIEARLPTTQEIDNIVRQVSDLAVAAGLEPPSIKTGKPLPAGLYMEQPLEMETKGSFLGFRSFLASVEKMQRVTRIHEMKIAQQKDDSGMEIAAGFTLSIYFQEEKVSSAQ